MQHEFKLAGVAHPVSVGGIGGGSGICRAGLDRAIGCAGRRQPTGADQPTTGAEQHGCAQQRTARGGPSG